MECIAVAILVDGKEEMHHLDTLSFLSRVLNSNGIRRTESQLYGQRDGQLGLNGEHINPKHIIITSPLEYKFDVFFNVHGTRLRYRLKGHDCCIKPVTQQEYSITH